MAQSNIGLPEFKIANLFEDMEVLKAIQSTAIKILEEDPNLEQEKNQKLNRIVKLKIKDKIEI